MEIFQSSDDLWEQVVKKSNKSLKTLDEDVALLDDWLKNQPHLPQGLLNTNSLRNFLLLNKFSVEVAKQKIDNYFTLRIKFEEIYGIQRDILFLVPSSKLTTEMYRIGYHKFKNSDLVDLYEPLSQIKRLLTVQDLRLRTDVMYGDVLVGDFKKLPLSAVLKVTPVQIYRGVKLYENVYSMRLKAVYIINLPLFARSVLAIYKKVMKPKLFERIHVLEDAETLKELLPLDLLPGEFGGEGPSLVTLEEALNKLYDQNSELFERLDQMTVNESLRPERENEDNFGVYGNFKNLEVD